MKNRVQGGFSGFLRDPVPSPLTPNRHRPGARNFFRSRPALLSTWWPTQLVGVGLASAVVAAAVLTALYRASRGKNGVTSHGILSRAEVIATGCAFTISTRSSHGFSL